MAAKPLTAEQLREVYDAWLRHNRSSKRAAAELRLKLPTFESRLKRAKAEAEGGTLDAADGSDAAGPDARIGGGVSYGDQHAELRWTSHEVRTIEDALAKAEVDTDIWRVKEFTVNSYEGFAKDEQGTPQRVTLWQIKAKLERRKPFDLETCRDLVIEQIAQHATSLPTPLKPSPPDNTEPAMVVLSLHDLHIGKYAWSNETGDDYDSEIAVALFEDAARTLLDKVRSFGTVHIDTIELIVGSDMLHTDSAGNTTTAGTPMDFDGRWKRSYRMGIGSLLRVIDVARAASQRMVIRRIRGNHDEYGSWWLAEVLRGYTHAMDDVEVVSCDMDYSFIEYGPTLVMVNHGDKVKPDQFESIMMNLQPEAFARCRYRETHIGHIHRARETRYIAGDTHGGMRLRVIPSLCGTDPWHAGKGWLTGPKEALALVYGRERGPLAVMTYNAPREAYDRSSGWLATRDREWNRPTSQPTSKPSSASGRRSTGTRGKTTTASPRCGPASSNPTPKRSPGKSPSRPPRSRS